jgi:hypothetical protein
LDNVTNLARKRGHDLIPLCWSIERKRFRVARPNVHFFQPGYGRNIDGSNNNRINLYTTVRMGIERVADLLVENEL